MRKYLLSLGLLFGLSPAAMANHVTYVSFDFSKADTDYFFCTVTSDKVTDVQMENHNVLISGFNKGGKLSLSGKDVEKLNKYYFTAKLDNKKPNHPNVIIHYNGDSQGDVKCANGKGDRSADIGGGFGFSGK